jgi:hypothetical protein
MKIKVQITMSIMALSNYHITTQHIYSVITDFLDLQLFSCPTN